MAFRTPVAALIGRLSRLSVVSRVPTGAEPHPVQCARCIHTQSSPLLFHITDVLGSTPMKKKKKMDPAVLIARENKRKKKIEKQMKRLEKLGRRLKPIDEIEGDPKIRRDIQMRLRPAVELSFEEREQRALLHKEWTRGKMREHTRESLVWAQVGKAQHTALEELRFESQELYRMAIQRDETLIPVEFKGPTSTPPLAGYEAPDGEYIDITNTYD